MNYKDLYFVCCCLLFTEFLFLFLFMSDYKLSHEQLHKLANKYKEVKNKISYIANRILIVIALGRGGSASSIAETFLIDADTVRRYFRLYKAGGINRLLEMRYEGRSSLLTDEQKEQLKQHLRENIYLDVKPLIVYVRETFGAQYSLSGITKLMHSLNFKYKKLHLVPSKPDSETQQKCVDDDNEPCNDADENNVFYFVDGVHPQPNSRPVYGWFERGVEAALSANSGRQRVNIKRRFED